MPWCIYIVCQSYFDLRRPYSAGARFCSGRCRAKASRERRALKVHERLEQAEAAIREAKEMLAVRPRSRKRPETAPGSAEAE